MEAVKRIIFTVTNDLSYDQRMARICRTLAGAGYEVELVGRRRRSSVPLAKKEYKQTRLSCFFSKGKLFYLEYNLRLFFFLLFRPCDIISAIDLDTLFPCTMVAKIRSRKLVFDAHEYFTEVPEVTQRPLVKKLWSLVGKWCVPHVHAAYTVSESLAEIFAQLYGKPFELIRNVPEATAATGTNAIHERVILYQGDLNEGRGLEQMIEAMQQVDAVFRIAGDGLLRMQLEQLAKEKNVQDRVRFLGYISPDELKAITQQAMIGLNVLEPKGLSYYYSLANKFFDYIQAGIPQVCAPFPEYEKINAQYPVALLCDCETAALANTVNNLLNDAVLYEKLRAATVKAKVVFCWETESQKLINLYAHVSR